MSAHRPGAISTFFIHKAGVFAAAFWAWLGILAVTNRPVSGWHIVAGTGAATTTLVGVLLGVRHAMQSSATTRHEEIMRALVEISWYSFASGARTTGEGMPAKPMTDADSRPFPPTAAFQDSAGEDADVIHLAGEIRQRKRR
jgi:hypothetical protein